MKWYVTIIIKLLFIFMCGCVFGYFASLSFFQDEAVKRGCGRWEEVDKGLRVFKWNDNASMIDTISWQIGLTYNV